MQVPKLPHQKFAMPAVRLGDAVLWAHNAGRMDTPAPAIVTQIGTDAIGLLYFPPDSRVGTPRDGVRHCMDPQNNRIESDAGVWDYSDGHKALLKLQADHERLADAVAASAVKPGK